MAEFLCLLTLLLFTILRPTLGFAPNLLLLSSRTRRKSFPAAYGRIRRVYGPKGEGRIRQSTALVTDYSERIMARNNTDKSLSGANERNTANIANSSTITSNDDDHDWRQCAAYYQQLEALKRQLHNETLQYQRQLGDAQTALQRQHEAAQAQLQDALGQELKRRQQVQAEYQQYQEQYQIQNLTELLTWLRNEEEEEKEEEWKKQKSCNKNQTESNHHHNPVDLLEWQCELIRGTVRCETLQDHIHTERAEQRQDQADFRHQLADLHQHEQARLTQAARDARHNRTGITQYYTQQLQTAEQTARQLRRQIQHAKQERAPALDRQHQQLEAKLAIWRQASLLRVTWVLLKLVVWRVGQRIVWPLLQLAAKMLIQCIAKPMLRLLQHTWREQVAKTKQRTLPRNTLE